MTETQRELTIGEKLPEQKNYLSKTEVAKYETGITATLLKVFEKSMVSKKEGNKRYNCYTFDVKLPNGEIKSVDNIFRGDLGFDQFPSIVQIRAVKSGEFTNWKITQG